MDTPPPLPSTPIKGRGASVNPPNRFEPLLLEPDPDCPPEERPHPRTQFFFDASESILTRNDSPDVPFTWGLNPYRGCEHGCAYCYARPSHAYLGLSPGLDFETRLTAKVDVARCLADDLRKSAYRPGVLAIGPNTEIGRASCRERV